MWTGVVGGFGIEALLESACRDLQNGAAEMYFGGFEIELIHAQAV